MDPYYERMTPQYKARKQAESVWPSVYKAVNGLFGILTSTLVYMVKSAIKSLKGD